MNQRQALCEASWNPIPFSRKGSHTNTKFKSTAKASPSSYATRRPQKLRFRGKTPWRSALPGRARSAVRATALLRAVTGKREPRLNCIKRQSATLPGARASGETPPSAQANFGRGPTLGAVQKTVPAPCPCCGFVRLQTHSPWASKHSILSGLWNVPLQEGTQGPKEASPARGARSPRRPERRTCKAGVPPPGGCGHRDPRYTHRCGAPREAGRGRSVPVGPRTRPVHRHFGKWPVTL